MHRRALITGLAASAAGPAVAASARWPSSQGLLDRYVAARKVPGAVLAVGGADEQPQFLSAGGLDYGGPAVGPDSLFRIYSMTKPVTGVAAMQLIEDGRLALDQPLADILPAFRDIKVMSEPALALRPATTPIRVRDLLTHTAGFSYHIHDTTLGRIYAARGIKPGSRQTAPLAGEQPPARDLEDFAQRLAQTPLDFDPGTNWQYSVGLDLMGLVIQRVSGRPFWEVVRERITGPLGMTDTDFMVPPEKTGRLTALYSKGLEGWRLSDPGSAASPFARDRDLPSGGGGLVSTARDYARFCQMLLRGGALEGARILRPQTFQLATSNLLPPGLTVALADGANGYGAGMQVVLPGLTTPGTEPPGSFGWSGQAGTTMWVDPVNRVYAVLMVQYLPGGAYPIYVEARQAVYRDLLAQGRVSSAL